MSHNQQLRPINSGLPVLVPVGGVTVHTCDSTAAASGGPYIDEVSLWLSNAGAALQRVTVAIGGGQSIAIDVPIGGMVQVLDKHPIRSSGAQVVCTNTTNTGAVTAWGHFTRST